MEPKGSIGREGYSAPEYEELISPEPSDEPGKEIAKKSGQWFLAAKVALDDVSACEFWLRINRGAELSKRRMQAFADFQDRRAKFLEETGIDIVAEQFAVVRSLLDRKLES